MAQLTARQILDLAYAALSRRGDVSIEQLRTSVAIALGESGGDTAAVGDRSIQTAEWGPSLGLWQIRSRWEDRGAGRPRDPQRLTDPAFNAESMASISSGGTNWTPWSVFTSGAYRSHLAAADAAIASLPHASFADQVIAGDGPVSDALGPVGDVLDAATPDGLGDGLAAIGRAAAAIVNPDNWKRLGAVVGGLVLVVVALRGGAL